MVINRGALLAELDLKTAKPTSPATHALLAKVFNPKDWHDKLVNRLLPVMAVGMAKAMVGQMLAMGVDIRGKRRKERGKKGGPGSKSFRGTKSTAMEWLAKHPKDIDKFERMMEDVDVAGMGILLELPLAMKKQIVDLLRESFSQDYWDGISETTGGAAELILESGLQEGDSIASMAKEIKEALGGDDYAGVRARNIARTESGGALNGARSASMEQLQEDVPQVPMKRVWLSVLGPTTRDTHAEADGLPEDEDGILIGNLISLSTNEFTQGALLNQGGQEAARRPWP
ncbi:MAG: phage minor head protein, partial [Thermoguttaceae bacterium]